MTAAKGLLSMDNISKDFPGVRALDKVNFTLVEGQIHGLLGSNGAGKSTLIKVLGGLYNDYQGQISIQGQPCKVLSPKQAADLGIAIIHQEFSLVPDLNVAENILLGLEPLKKLGAIPLLDWNGLHAKAESFLKELGFDVPIRAKVRDLSVAQQQLVQIAKALVCNAKILVMDEPTARLSSNERNYLFQIMRRLKDAGVGIVYISHFLEEVFLIADHITVLRDGKNILSKPAAELNHLAVVKAMVGKDMAEVPELAPIKQGKAVLEVKNLSDFRKFWDISFTLHQGEILGLTGLVGSGRTEVARAIFGLGLPTLQGEMILKGEPFRPHSPQEAMAQGLALLPEDRKQQGLILIHPVSSNLTLTTLKRLTKGPFIDHGAKQNSVNKLIRTMEIKCASDQVLANTLSGGNQQKVVIGKWLAMRPDVLILDQPTAGIDIGTKAEIYRLMEQLAAEGISLIVISDEPEELARVAHRVLIMRKGRMVKELPGRPTSEEVLAGVTAEY